MPTAPVITAGATTAADIVLVQAAKAAADVAKTAADLVVANEIAATGASPAVLDTAAANAAADVVAAQAVIDAMSGTAPTAAGASSTDVTSRLRIVITATAESDAGVTFGAMTRIQQGEGQTGATSGARFFAKSGGLEVGVGNIWGALESMPGQHPIDLGLTGLGYEYTVYGVGGADAYSSGGLGSSGANGIEVMYSMGDFSAHISASDTNDRIAAYGAYTFSGWTVALGLQDSTAADDVEQTLTVGPVSLGLAYAKTNAGVVRTVLSAGMDVGAATNVEAYYADQSDKSDSSYGIDFNHSLGGGTSLRGGVASKFNGQTVADFGVRFNF